MLKTPRATDLEPIDRLEEKVKLLIDLVDRLRAEQARAAEENLRLARDLELARARLTESERSSSEVAALKAERDEVRSRVAEMLEQLEALHL